MAPSGQPRTSRQRLGARAELAVEHALVQEGFTILGRNVRVGRFEIDLLVKRQDLIAVVEVRTRGAGSWLGPLQSISPAKRQRLRTAGRILWSRRFAHDPSVQRMRFDVAAVCCGPNGETTIDYVSAAF
jgi:putative endonuclease